MSLIKRKIPWSQEELQTLAEGISIRYLKDLLSVFSCCKYVLSCARFSCQLCNLFFSFFRAFLIKMIKFLFFNAPPKQFLSYSV